MRYCILLYTTAFLGQILLLGMVNHLYSICVISFIIKEFSLRLMPFLLYNPQPQNFSPLKNTKFYLSRVFKRKKEKLPSQTVSPLSGNLKIFFPVCGCPSLYLM